MTIFAIYFYLVIVTAANLGENKGAIVLLEQIKHKFSRLEKIFANSVLNRDFEQLAIKNEVRFSEEVSDKGLQATTVRVVGKHHVVGEY